MAKAQSPVRLRQDLMTTAATTGTLFNRSATEQVEYWATIGRKVQNLIGADTLLDVQSGALNLCIEEAKSVRVDPEDVFAAMDRDNATGALAASLSEGQVRYQASQASPGLLEQINADGSVIVGTFSGGKFTPKN